MTVRGDERMNDQELPRFDDMTDREMLLEIAQNLRKILALVGSIKDQVQPTLETLKSNPLMKMMGL